MGERPEWWPDSGTVLLVVLVGFLLGWVVVLPVLIAFGLLEP